jgi:hypothetical protein
MLSAIVVLTLVPPSLRPTTSVPHNTEHAGIFLTVGILFGIAYPGHERILSVGAIVFCAAIELVQLYVPGRHARISDFVVDGIAGLIGVFVGSFLPQKRQHPLPKAAADPEIRRSESGQRSTISRFSVFTPVCRSQWFPGSATAMPDVYWPSRRRRTVGFSDA